MFFYNLSVVTLKILSNGTHFPSHNLFHVVFICSPLKPLLPSSLKWHLIDFRIKSKQLYMFWETLITGSFLSLKSLYPTLYFHTLPEPCLTYLNSLSSSRSLSFLDLWSHSLKFSSPSFEQVKFYLSFWYVFDTSVTEPSLGPFTWCSAKPIYWQQVVV